MVLLLVLYMVTLIPLAVSLRWGVMPTRNGPSFASWPDGLEYAAGAQAIADTGRYFLQVGPHRVRPRYSPGFSMLLAPLLWLGLDSRDLCRVPAVFAGLQAVLVAIVVLLVIRFLSEGARRRGWRDWWVPGAGGFLAGVAWAVAPISLDSGRYLMSDEVGAFFANLSFLLAALGLLAQVRARVWLILFFAGVALGVTSSIRSVEGFLLGIPLLLIFLTAGRLRGARISVLRVLPLALGFLVPAGMTSYLLHASGFDPWSWSAYEFWAPEWYGDLTKTFSLQYALHGEPIWPLRSLVTGEGLGFYWGPLQIFLGIQATAYYGFGEAWSWIGLPAFIYLAYRTLDGRRGVQLGILLAVLVWILGHVLLFTTYFFHAERFYLAPAAVWCMGIGSALGLCFIYLPRALHWLPPLVFLWFLFGESKGVEQIWTEKVQRRPPEIEEVQRELAPWLRLSDSIRAGLRIPFDTVIAQAMGLLPSRVVEGIGSWGRLEGRYYHARTMLARGYIATPALARDDRELKPPSMSLYPEGTRALGQTELRFEESDMSLRFVFNSPDQDELLHYRVPLRDEERQGCLRIDELHNGLAPVARMSASDRQGRMFDMDFLGLTQFGETFQLRFMLRAGEESLMEFVAVLRLQGRSLRVRLVSADPVQLESSIVLRLETSTPKSSGVHVAGLWDWFSSQASRVSRGGAGAKTSQEGHPILGKNQMLSPGSVGTFYVTVSQDAHDLETVRPESRSPYASLMFEVPLLCGADGDALAALRAKMQELALPSPLHVGVGRNADVRLLDSSPGLETSGKAIGESLYAKAAFYRKSGEAGPIATSLREANPMGIRSVLEGSVDLLLLGPGARVGRRSPSERTVPLAREVPADEDVLERARRIRSGILPLFDISSKGKDPWESILLRYVYLELPLLRAITESPLLTESAEGGEGRFRLKFENGLQLWMNLAHTPWSVSLEDQSYRLGRGGYLAMGSGGFLAGFTVDADGREMRFLRGVDGIRARYLSRVDILDEAHGLVYEDNGGPIVLSRLPRSKPDRLALLPLGAPRLGLGQKRLRLRFSRVDGKREVTERGDIAWESLDPEIATVDRFGIVQIRGAGKARIRATRIAGQSGSEIMLSASLKPIVSDIRRIRGSHGLAISFRCDRPCIDAGVIIQSGDRPDAVVLASHDPSWMSFSCWIPDSSIGKKSTLTITVRDQFDLQGSTGPLPIGR